MDAPDVRREVVILRAGKIPYIRPQPVHTRKSGLSKW